MFDFPASPSRSPTRRWTALASIGVHALVIVAVIDHKPPVPLPTDPAPEFTDIWVPPQPRTAPPPDEPETVSRGTPDPLNRIPDFPEMVPDQLPPPDLSGTPIDPRSLTGTSATGNFDSLVNGITGPASPGASLNWRQVDEPPRLIESGPLNYPPALEGTGLEGWVRLQFTVDTLGRALPNSLRILAASHSLFSQSARETVLGSRFEPGRERGRAVPVLVEQVVSFK